VQRLARNGTPLLRDLRAAAPQVNRFTSSFDAFEKPAPQALAALGRAAATGRRAVKPARPVAANLRRLATAAVPTVRDLDALAADARDQGVFEFLNHLSYGMSSGTGAYDRNGHLLLIFLDALPRCIIAGLLPGTQPAPACSHAFYAPGSGQIPASQTPPPASREKRLTTTSVDKLLDYLLKK
jgi:ABC-type transporter Mla subunit MlaD